MTGGPTDAGRSIGRPVIGVLGGGQLGRMLALAGSAMGFRFRIYEAAGEAPAGQVAPIYRGAWDDEAALATFADGVNVVTYEFENVPVATARFLAAKVPVHPPPDALAAAQDRLHEKTLFQRLEIPGPGFRDASDADSLERAIRELSGAGARPVVVKTRRGGYDGKGQAVVQPGDGRSTADVWSALGGVPLLVEEWIPFDGEASIVAARGVDGDVRFYPLTQNLHRGGILRRSVAPAPLATPALQAAAEAYAARVADALRYVGVFALEFFVRDGALLVNEMAPRVHNSGHRTTEGAETSQFENHVRAVVGLPLGSTAMVGRAGLVNLIGRFPDRRRALETPGAHWHDYGKAERPGRKVGHVTLRCLDADATTFDERLQRLERWAADAEGM
ncbi:MAG: 5-(carboxyamino)imidazole ribonucleotide synthase [Planctomycetia bacterium]